MFTLSSHSPCSTAIADLVFTWIVPDESFDSKPSILGKVFQLFLVIPNVADGARAVVSVVIIPTSGDFGSGIFRSENRFCR